MEKYSWRPFARIVLLSALGGSTFGLLSLNLIVGLLTGGFYFISIFFYFFVIDSYHQLEEARDRVQSFIKALFFYRRSASKNGIPKTLDDRLVFLVEFGRIVLW